MKYITLLFYFYTALSIYMLGYLHSDINKIDKKLIRYEMKIIPTEFIVACNYINEANEKNARIMVDTYNILNNCQEVKSVSE